MKSFPLRHRFPASSQWVAIAFVLALVGTAGAHPGHGLLEHGPLHTITSPFHLSVLALIGVTLFAGSRLVQRQLPRRVLAGLGTITLVASAVMWGLRG